MTNYTLSAAPGGYLVTSGANAHAVYGTTLGPDGIRLAYSVPAVARGYALNGGGIGIAPAQTVTWQPTALIADILQLHQADVETIKYGVNLSDQAIMSSLLNVGIPAALVDGIGTHDVLSVIRGLVLAEKLGIGAVLNPTTKYGLTVAEHLRFLDGLFRFFSGTLSDGVGTHDGQIVTFQPTARVVENIGLHDAQTASLVIGMNLAENIRLTHTQVLKMIYAGTLLDGLQMRALHILPNGTYTTWAINTRTGAVTEYSNFVFNSFCQMGHHYLGANDQGIWVLDGERDNGTNIIADVLSGKMQLGGSKFTSFRSVYLGINVRDDSGQSFVLKMIAGDGRQFVYAVKPNAPGLTTKVNMGKGLRSRYFQFELVSSGADFDLDSVEFVPIISQRRV